MHVFSDKVLLLHIGSFTRGISPIVLEFEQQQLSRCVFKNPNMYPKRVEALPQITIMRNNQVVLKALYSLSTHPLLKQKTKFQFGKAIRCAAYFNRLDILQCKSLTLFNADLSFAARRRHLAVLKWLHEHTYDISGHTFNLDATHGHIDVVRYLRENGIGGCTTDAMDYAAIHGHLEVVQFLHGNRSEGCTPAAIDQAAGNGHYAVVAFLCEYRSKGFTDAVKRAKQPSYSSITTSLQMVEIEGLRGNGASSG